MTELKPCPFCGGEAVLVPTLDTTVREWFVTCANLHCNVLACRTKRFYTEAEAIEAWNTRAERTCRKINPSEKDWFVCSECRGQCMGDQYGELPNYCANCGAEVVE